MIQQSPTEERARALLAKIVERTSVGKHGQPTTRSKYGNYPAALYHEAVATLASQAAQPAEADGGTLRSSIFEVLRRHEVSEQCFAEIAALTYAATPKTPTSTAGEVDWAQVGRDYAEKALSGGIPHVQSPQYALSGAFKAMADEITRLRALATPPAPNDDLRAAIAAALPGITAMVEHLQHWHETGAVAGPDESRLLYEGLRASLAALKENRRG